MGRSFKELCKKYNDYFLFSKEMRYKLAQNNLKNLFYMLHAVFVFGVLNLLYHVIAHWNHGPGSHKYIMIYYFLYIATSFWGILLTTFIKYKKPKSLFIIQLPFKLLFISGLCICVYNCVVVGNYYSSIVAFACLGIITIIFLYINSIFYGVMLIIYNIAVFHFIHMGIGKTGLMDIFILSGLLFILNLYKLRVTKYDMLHTEMLEENRDALQESVVMQVKEIQQQNEQLKQQHQKIVDIQNNTIISLSNLVENRDSDTGEHVRRTSAYVNLIARKAKTNNVYTDVITEDFIELLTKAAPMHDIGKIVVPDDVLKKPAKLNESEFEQIKRHTTEGGRIVKEILGDNEDQAYVNMAIEVATSHHERWDGTGYPFGLKGEEIPLSARIMAIADVFDALVSPRVYKEPFTVEDAMKIIKDEAGSHFDKKLVDLFVAMEDDAVAVMEKYRD